jgi:hypothetical protein
VGDHRRPGVGLPDVDVRVRDLSREVERMSAELVLKRKFRKQVPESHRVSLDTRIQWLWNQRFGSVQMVWKESKDVLDHTAATLILQAIMGKDIESIFQIFQRLEGGPISDEQVAESKPSSIRI